MGTPSIKTAGRVLESLCLGCSPKGPRQLEGEGAGNGAKRKSQRDSPSKLPRSSLCALPFSVHMATALAPSHFLRAQPTQSLPSPARPGLSGSHCLVPRADPCSRTMLPCPQGHVWHRCHKDWPREKVSDAGTDQAHPRSLPLPTQTFGVSSLPSDTPGSHSNYSNQYQSPSLHIREKTHHALLGAFPGFFRAWSGVSGRTSEGYFPTKPPQRLWLVRSEQLGNEVTLTLWEVNRAQTPKTNQGIFSRVGMMQPCCCGDFPGFPGKLNCAFSWRDENLGPTTHTAGPQHRDTRSGTSPICLKTCPASHPQNVSLFPSIPPCWTLVTEVGEEFLGWAGGCGKHRGRGSTQGYSALSQLQ